MDRPVPVQACAGTGDVLLKPDLVYGDETILEVLKERGRVAQTKGYLWAQMNDTGPPGNLLLEDIE
jgi:hypothetical protein